MISESFKIAFMNPGKMCCFNKKWIFNVKKKFSEDIFKFSRTKASLYKKSYCLSFFGRTIYCIIKAKDAEVEIYYCFKNHKKN